ncbi:Polynucleotide kinase 3 phosphatase, partial [Aphelenchoides avenae]
MADLRKAWKHIQSRIEDKGRNPRRLPRRKILKRKPDDAIKHKFDLRFDGPYRIKSINPPNVVIQRLHEQSKPYSVHVDQVKKFKASIGPPIYAEEATAIRMLDQEGTNSTQHTQANGRWREIPGVALIYTTTETEGRTQVLGLDLDETIVRTKSGGIFAENADDWKWYSSAVPDTIRELYSAGFKVCIFTNQKGIQLGIVKPVNFKRKAESICNALGIPMQVFASIGDSRYRKPNVGLWLLMEKEENESIPVNRSRCIF